MEKSLYKKIAKNLLVGGSLIAVLIGFIVALIELERVDEYVVKLAVHESSKISDKYHDCYHLNENRDASCLGILDEAIKNDITDDIFILIEIYDDHKNKIIEHTGSNIEVIVRALEEKKHIFPLTQKADYLKILHKRNLYLKIITPIIDQESSRIIGYFEGIYHVPKEQTSEIINRVTWSIVQAVAVVLLTTFLLFPIILFLNRGLVKRSQELLQANVDTLNALGTSIAKRDNETDAHNYRVTLYAINLAEAVNLKHEQIQSIIKGAFLHDVGKIGISDNLLLKAGKLSNEEFETMKEHVIYGIDIVQSCRWLEDAGDVVRYHHEKYDGSGYIKGLKGDEIPLNARIFTIADVFDALTSKRPYKEAFTFEASITIMKEDAKGHFDPVLFAAFEKIARELYEKVQSFESENRLQTVLEGYIEYYFRV